MKRSAVFVAILLLFTGCGRSAFFGFTSSSVYNDSLSHTKKLEINDKFESKLLLTATYLSAVYPEKYGENESFLIGLYITDDFKDEKAGINNPNFKITLNSEPFLGATELDKEDQILKQMPLINRWSRYYIVDFEHNESSQQTLSVLDIDTNQSKSVNFTK